MDHLFTTAPATLDAATATSLVFLVFGMLAVASSLQQIYEKVFRQGHLRGLRELYRLLTWIAVLCGAVVAESLAERPVSAVAVGDLALAALKERRAAQAADRLKAGEVWQESGLVFTTTIGTMLDQHNIRREFREITKAAGLGTDWVPRELRHTFVSIMSAGGVPVEEIARVAGHKQTSTTELVYRRELRPVITTGAELMDKVFSRLAGEIDVLA
jgi:site-specific recombinase XerC